MKHIKLVLIFIFYISTSGYAQTKVEKWDVFEIELKGKKEGNPFKDLMLSAIFSKNDSTILVKGFYDGEGVYRIRFMPTLTGEWSYVTQSNERILNNKKGKFTCIEPSDKNYGPVQVADQYHFRYANGNSYNCFGTTTYDWINQPEALKLQTIETLKNSPFNKNRMLIFPKSLFCNETEPQMYPFPLVKTGSSKYANHWEHPDLKIEWEFDWEHFNVDFFRNLDSCVYQLREIGVEADIILLHPYDRWGFAQMSREQDIFFIDYVMARLGAFRNVWWSLSNEYDYMAYKTVEDWNYYGEYLMKNDPWHHLIGIHNGPHFFDHTKPFISHLSVQSYSFDIEKWNKEYGKPVVIDEMGYEGTMDGDWGVLSGLEMTHRFWEVMMKSGYAGHSEAFHNPEDIYWWNKGGTCKGESMPRIDFLRKIIESGPETGIVSKTYPAIVTGVSAWKTDSWILGYFGRNQPSFTRMQLPENKTYHLYYIDIWHMTITKANDVIKTNKEATTVPLAAKPYSAILLSDIELQGIDKIGK
jgi:hypothetical protein